MKLKLRTLLPAAIALVSALTLFAQSTPEQAVRKTEAAKMFGKLPLSFEPSPDATAYVAHSGASLVTVSNRGGAVAVRDALTQRSQSVRFLFEQSSATAALAALDEQQGVTNYQRGNDPAKWRLGVKNYGRVQVRGVYPGVDVVYYGDHRRMEFDFNVAPGADASGIALRFDGQERLYTDANGDLVAEVLGQPVRFARPYAYQRVAGGTKAVEAGYVLMAGNVVRMKLGEYDKTSELVIDPVVTYATYVGGSGIDVANGIAVDVAGNAYITGQTASSDFPKPNNPTGYSFSGGSDAYVVKLSADGQTFVYTTILGGTNPTLGFAQGNGIAVDANRQAYIVGGTSFKDLPGIINSYQGGDSDAFIIMLDANGVVVRSTYLGGSAAEIGYGIAVDTTGGINTVTAVGQTCSWDYPTYNAIETKVEACAAFITKLDNGLHVGGKADPTSSAQSPAPASCGGATCYFSTYFAGQPVPPYPTAVYASNATYIYAAIVEDTNNPPNIQIDTTGGYCTTGASIPTWNTTLYGTTIDGTCYWLNAGPPASPSASFYTEAYGVALDPVGDVFVVGGTNSTTMSTYLYPYNARGGTGAWILKLSKDHGVFIYGTTLEATPTDETLTIDTARAVAVDSQGQAYVVGTATGTLYTSANAYQKNVAGGTDAFLVRLNNQGSAIEFATYFGGSKDDQALGVAVDSNLTAYIAGTTKSPDFPTTNALENPNSSVQLTLSGGQDAFITKFTSDGSALIFSSYLGGSGSDQANAIAVDSTNLGNMYVAGNTSSLDLETTLNLQPTPLNPIVYTPPQTSNAGNGDGFVAMVPSSGLPEVSVTPGSLYFVDQDLNTQSAAQAVQYTNTSTTASVTIQSIVFNPSANFGQSFVSGSPAPNCTPDVIAASSVCDIWVTFTPTVVGTTTGTLTITDSASSEAHVINLLGQGAAPYDVLSTSSLTFATQGVSTTSAAQSITLQNTGKGTLYISSLVAQGITVASDFAQTNTCGAQLSPGGSCTISVTFTPSGTGTRNGAVTITDNAQGSPHVVSLTGTGRLVTNTFSTTSLIFPQQQIKADSAPQTITIQNTDASQNLVINSVTVSPSFLISLNTCASAAILPGGTCAIQVEFDPSTSGSFTGTLSIVGNGTLMPGSISLSGTAGATATLTPANLNFPGTVVGVTSPAQSVTLANLSTFPFNISSAVLSGAAAADFSLVNNCGTSLSALPATCTFSISFTPSAAGNRNAVLTVTSDAAASPQTVNILGVGLAPAVTLSQGATQNVTSISFGNQAISEASTPIVLTLTNSGTAPLNMSSITFTGAGAGEFSQTNTCGTQVLAGSNCTINVVFTPSALNGQGATLVITDNATPSSQTVALNGYGVQPTAPSFNPTTAVGLAFGGEPVNSTTAAQTITVTNNDANYAITLGTPVMAGDFAVQASGTTCGTLLAKSTSCVIAVTFTPTATGSRTGTLTLSSNALTNAAVFPLTGTGTTPVVSLSPTSLTFSSQADNTASAAQTITLTNTGNGALTLNSIAISGTNSGDFAQTNTCTGTVAASGGNCTISVTFTPTAVGSRSASVVFTDNASGSPQSVPLTGTGIAGSGTLSLSPTTLAFGNVAKGSTSLAQTVTISNTNTSQVLNVTGIVISGSSDFAIVTSGCSATPFNLAVGGSCTVSIKYAPTVLAAESATLTVSAGSTNSPQTVSLTGTGIAAQGTLSLSPSTISFGSIAEGTSSAAQTITISNTSTTSSLAVTGIVILTNTDFSVSSSTCGNTPFTLATSGSCTVSVIYSPTVLASETANFTVTADSANSPQAVQMSGTGTSSTGSQPYTVTPSTTGVSVVQGGTATYTLTVAPQAGYTQTIDFTCSGPTNSTCTMSPTSLTMDGSTVKTTTLTVTTTGGNGGSASMRPAQHPLQRTPAGIFYALLPFTIFGIVLLRRGKGWKAALVVAAIGMAMFMASCGGGGSSSSSTNLAPGTYNVTVTATSTGSTVTTVKTTLQLVVTSK